MSRSKKRRAARAAYHLERWAEARKIAAEQLGHEPSSLSEFRLVEEICGRLSYGLPRDAAELRRLRSLCTTCGESGHRSYACPEIVCHVCGAHGHKRRDCPTLTSSQ